MSWSAVLTMLTGFAERMKELERERQQRLENRREALETEDQAKRAAALEQSTAGRFKGGKVNHGKRGRTHDEFLASLEERRAETHAKLASKKASKEQKEDVRWLLSWLLCLFALVATWTFLFLFSRFARSLVIHVLLCVWMHVHAYTGSCHARSSDQ